MKPTVTIDEAARIIGCSRRNVYYLIAKQALQVCRYPNQLSWRIMVPAEWPRIIRRLRTRNNFVKEAGQNANP